MSGGRREFLAGAAGTGLGALACTVLGAGNGEAQPSPTLDSAASSELEHLADGRSDAAPALERLFARAAAGTGGTVLLPPGRFRLARRLTVPRDVTLVVPRGARLTGGQAVQVQGSVEAGPYRIFEDVLVEFGPGSVPTWVIPQWWGARGDGVHDDTAALQSALNARLVFVPAGKYRTTRELVVKNRSTIFGVGNSWSPRETTDSWIQYDGPADDDIAVLRVASAPVGQDPTSAIDSVHIDKLVLNGGNRAGYGLYSVFCSNDSSMSDVTARHCTRHGIFISQQWYASYRNLVARNNAGCGITIGALFEGWRERGVNGIEFNNLRAANNGADRHFDERTNLRWGYGVYFRPGAGTVLRQVVSENNFGPGLIYDLGPFGANRVDGAYLEKNGIDARVAGARRPWGLVVLGHRNARANRLTSVYLHGGIGDSRAQSIWLTGDEPAAELVLDDVSLGHHFHADWSRYSFRGYVYPGLRDYIAGSRPADTRAGAYASP